VEKRRLGRTEIMASRLGFGGMTIPRVSREQAIATVHKALDLGVNFIDTATGYGKGESEERIGEVMKTRREECYLSSRVNDADKAAMARAIDASLKRLKTDHIDIYEAHDVSTQKRYDLLLGPGRAIEALQEAREAGKIRFIGVTTHNWRLARQMIETDLFDAMLITYNISNREAEEWVIPVAKKHDVGLFVMKVFGNGRLLDLTPPGEDRHPTIRECLRFALANQELPVILTGVKSPDEVAENVAIVEEFEGASEEELAELRAFGDKLSRGYCYNCRYCVPCPAEIDVPRIVQLSEYIERISWEWPQAKAQYQALERNYEDCLDCGQCEEKCPQNIPVRERLKQAHEKLAS